MKNTTMISIINIDKNYSVDYNASNQPKSEQISADQNTSGTLQVS